MDRKIEKKRNPLKIVIGVGGTIGVLLLGYLTLTATRSNTLTVEREKVRIEKVIRGNFQDEIPIQGVVEPLTSVVITAPEGGNVEEIFVEDGILVEKGTPLMRLTNSSLMLDFMSRETQVVEQINNLRNTRLSLEERKRTLEQQYNQVVFDLKEAQRNFEANKTLFKDSAIAENDYLATVNRFEFLTKQKELISESMRREALNREQQLDRIDASISLMERNLHAIQRTLDNLTIKAPITGQLTSFDPQLGESKTRGENLGTINVMDGYKVTAMVDEYYLSRVFPGQIAVSTTRGLHLTFQVIKVIPEVTNGQFEIHLSFQDSIPESITRGQSIQLRLALSKETTATMVPIGGFYQSTGGNWIFVINEEGNAEKRQVELGRKNTTHIEVINGLTEGEQVVTNSYASYGDASQLYLEE